MISSVAIKQGLFRFAEIIHLRIFGHEMGEEMRIFLMNLSIIFIGSFFSSGILFLVNILGGRLLGPAEYGKFQVMISIAQFLVIPMLLGLSTASVKHIAEAETHEEKSLIIKTATVSFSVFTLCSVIILFSLKEYFSRLFGVQLNFFLYSVALAVLLGTFNISRSFLQGLKKMKEISLLDFLYSLVIFLSFFFLLKLLKGYDSLYYAYLSGYVFFSSFALFLSLNKKTIIFDVSIFKKITHYGLYAIFGSAAGLLIGNIDKLILNKYYSAESVGIYSAYLIASTVVFAQIMQIVITVFFPTVSSINDKSVIIKKLNRLEAPIFILSTIASMVLISFSLKIMGAKFVLNGFYLTAFAINAGVVAAYQLKMWMLNSEGLRGVSITVKGAIGIGIINFFICLILIPKFAIYGASISLLTANIFLYYYFSYQLKKMYLC